MPSARCRALPSTAPLDPAPLAIKRAPLPQATAHKTDAEKFGWSFVLELHATEEARASSNASVREAPHWLVVPGAWWRYPQGPGSSVKDRLGHPVVHVSFTDAKARC